MMKTALSVRPPIYSGTRVGPDPVSKGDGSVEPPQSSTELVRVMGRWTLTALMVNTMIGASIFGLPSLLAAHLGRQSPAAYFIAAAGVGIVAACLAEVASQFRETGGPYLYARAAFGRFAAIQVGWLTWLSRITAASAVANLFVSYLAQFVPRATDPVARAGVLALLIALLAVVNYRGVSGGSRLSNLFTVTKMVLLLVFIVGGLAALVARPELRVDPPARAALASDWFEAVILMVYAYGGFEAALFASGEAENPRRDTPAALLIALATVTVLYVSVQYVVMHTLPDPAASPRPAADAALRFFGPLGASLVAAGTLVSAYGYLSANMLHTPRVTFAMAAQGDFPVLFGAVHPRFRTPHVSIVAFAVLLLAFSIAGNFRWNATLSAISRLIVYGSVAAALPVLRRKRARADAFRLPGGGAMAGLALLFTGVLATQMHSRELVALGITFGLGLANWIAVRRTPPAASAAIS
jgi:amino acid transporter